MAFTFLLDPVIRRKYLKRRTKELFTGIFAYRGPEICRQTNSHIILALIGFLRAFFN
jgi:hypothetical protein